MSLEIANKAVTKPPQVRPHGIPPRGIDMDTRSRLFEGRFGRLFRALPPADFGSTDTEAEQLLESLAVGMIHDPDCPKDGADDEESGIPSAYTYLGQFIDHDITFDPSSSLMRQNDPDALIDFRTPRLDLDSVYGRGPDDQPYLYGDNKELLLGKPLSGNALGKPIQKAQDLARAANHRAMIGDPRNDENAIVSQLQGLVLRFHNNFRGDNPDLSFEQVQQQVRFHYQWVVTHDFLRRIVSSRVLEHILPHLFESKRAKANVVDHPPQLRFYRPVHSAFMPLEFAAAAYRFGHSMVRPGYRLNDAVAPLPIFSLSKLPAGCVKPVDDLRGFRDMNPAWAIDWARFIDLEKRPAGLDGDSKNDQSQRTQLAYKIDPSLVDPLSNLPETITGPNPGAFKSLAARNLVRGWRMRLPSGQDIARAIGVEPLADDDILIQSTGDAADKNKSITKAFPKFSKKCPLWAYILAEAAHGFRTHPESETVHTSGGDKKIDTPKLGDVGGTIVAETFAGMMVDDRNSFWNLWPKWEPSSALGGRDFDFRRFIEYALR
jgi:Animal haem peroxidase